MLVTVCIILWILGSASMGLIWSKLTWGRTAIEQEYTKRLAVEEQELRYEGREWQKLFASREAPYR